MTQSREWATWTDALVRTALAALLTLPAMGSAANDEGIVTLSPPSARIAALDTVALDVVLDFSPRPAVRGGLSIRWDPAVFEFVGWDVTGATISGEPPFTSAPVLNAAAGTLSDARIGNSSLPLTTPGVLATLRLRALAGASDCGSAVDVEPSAANPWLEAFSLNLLSPSYRRARVAVGGDVCTSPPLASDVADLPGRCIGVLPPGAGTNCPEILPNDWDVSPLFDALQVSPGAGIAVPLADHMARYCVYDRRPGRSSDCALIGARGAATIPGFVIEPATMAAAVQGGSTLESLFRPALQAHFLEQAGQLATTIAGTTPVRLSIIDTMDIPVARGAAEAGASETPLHGDALRRFASALVTVPGVELWSGIALPFNCFKAETCLALCGDTEGCVDELGLQTGFLGSPESVARAVHETLVRWSADGGGSRLVINASLGWRPEFNTGQNGPRVGYQAFVDSLTEAACLGAIVIGAAGNANSGPGGSDGLLSPATESAIAAPDLATCEALGYTPPAENFDAPRPLIYPVAAVNSADEPVLVRDNALPPIVAFGDHAALLGPAIDGGLLPTLTGSSVASLVTSAAASALWSLVPEASPGRIMSELYQGATPLTTPADLCVAGLPCAAPVRRVSVCPAFERVCADLGLDDCPVCALPRPVQVAPGDTALDDMELTLATASTRTVDLGDAVVVNGVDVSDCRGSSYTLYQSPASPDILNPCPHDQFYATLETPWATGQPEHQSCENCSMTERSPGKLLVEINAGFGTELSNPTLLEATLLCRQRSTGAINAFRLPDTDPGNVAQRGFAPGEQLLITNVPNDLCAGDDLSLAFRIDSGDEQNDRPASLVQQLIVIRHDEDDDDVPDFRDNCLLAANDSQRDTDGDGYGNACDADIGIPNDCVVNVVDLGVLRAAFFSTPGSGTWNPDADFNGDGVVNVQDLGLLRASFFGAPGPSAASDVCGD